MSFFPNSDITIEGRVNMSYLHFNVFLVALNCMCSGFGYLQTTYIDDVYATYGGQQ